MRAIFPLSSCQRNLILLFPRCIKHVLLCYLCVKQEKTCEFRLDCQDNVCKINGVSLTVLKANLVGFLLK